MKVMRIMEWSVDKQSWLAGYRLAVDFEDAKGDPHRANGIMAVSYTETRPSDTWGGWPFLLKELVGKLGPVEVEHTELPKGMESGYG